jgi:glucokinase
MLLNDCECMSYSMLCLSCDSVHKGSPSKHTRLLVCPGTGLGVSVLLSPV